ncbi:MAG: hypothetical protein H6709_18000 [Kofleriaceae bacterium]|nr:hypothetical protein [Kofleriaceae bacterium]MCB9573978.1 hypothetical protein [Kofleriaceae bacterium]
MHFNQLPKSVRERFIAATHDQGSPTPLLATKMTPGGMIAWAVIAVLVAVFTARFAWSSGITSPYSGPWQIPGLVALTGIVLSAAWVVFAAVKRQLMKSRMPYVPGMYLLGADLIDARSPQLRVVPLMACRPQIVHHHYNGAYVRTSFRFTPPTGGAFEFSVRPRHAAEAVIDEIEKTIRLVAVVKQIGDQEVLAKIDVFAGLRDGDGNLVAPSRPPDPVPPLAADVPSALARPALAALVASALLGPGLWYLRNRAHDHAAFEHATSSYELRAYLGWGKLHRAEAQKRYFELSLEEAKRADSVTALRTFLTQQADAPEELKVQAREAIHEFFAAALEKFRAVASNDAETVAFVERLLAFEEQHDSPGLIVQFRPPRTEQLTGMDGMVKEMAGDQYDFAPLAPQFSDATAGPRESEIVTNLTTGFGQVFTQDVLHLENGGRLSPEGEPPTDRASIEVSYEVQPYFEDDGSPVIYTMTEPLDSIMPPGAGDDDALPTGKRLYLGIEVAFDITMRVPGEAQPRTLTLLVQPPERFTVSTSGYGSNPDDSSIYSVMSSRAFDQLQAKLSSAFFTVGDTTGEGAMPELLDE